MHSDISRRFKVELLKYCSCSKAETFRCENIEILVFKVDMLKHWGNTGVGGGSGERKFSQGGELGIT